MKSILSLYRESYSTKSCTLKNEDRSYVKSTLYLYCEAAHLNKIYTISYFSMKICNCLLS